MSIFRAAHYSDVAAIIRKGYRRAQKRQEQAGPPAANIVNETAAAVAMAYQMDCVMADFAAIFRRDNERFDYDRFRRACDPGDPTA